MSLSINTTRYYQIILNTPEVDLKTGRINSTTIGREVTLKKLGSTEMQFERETDHGHCGREGRVRAKLAHRGAHGKNESHTSWLEK